MITTKPLSKLRLPKWVRSTEYALTHINSLMRQFTTLNLSDSWGSRMKFYKDRPERFAADILGSYWWPAQTEVARAVAGNRRVVVKSANGVGKTFLAADLVIWFLCTRPGAIVLTTAPTWRQVRNILWQEIRRKIRFAKEKLPGTLTNTRMQMNDGWYALGLSSNDAVRFQGFHAEHLLIVLDEASGINEEIWEAVEGIAVGRENKVLAIGNPLVVAGRFYRLFRDNSGWSKHSISAFDHPNMKCNSPPKNLIQGCITREALEERVNEWTDDYGPAPPKMHDFQFVSQMSGDTDNESSVSGADRAISTPVVANATPDRFVFRGNVRGPNNLFRARVMGQFPTAETDTLIPLNWIESAIHASSNHETKTAPTGWQSVRRMAVDVARFGNDKTVIGIRTGPDLIHMETHSGCDTMDVAGKIVSLAYDHQTESITIDSIGIGSGVVDRLRQIGIEGVNAVNVSLPAHDSERFANKRAELYWGLRERFRLSDIRIPKQGSTPEYQVEKLVEELAAIKYRINSKGQIQMESKDDMKRRGQSSPDHADMLVMLYDGAWDYDWGLKNSQPSEPSELQKLRDDMSRW